MVTLIQDSLVRPGTVSILTPNDGIAQLWSTSAAVTSALISGLKATFGTQAYQRFNEHNSLTPMEIPGDQVLSRLTADTRRYTEMVAAHGIDLHDVV